METRVRVRDDDVLVASSTYKSVFNRFVRIHEIIVANNGVHVPAILCNSIMEFPDCIDFVRHETSRRRMIPELHGWNHINYDTFSEKELEDDLCQCIAWFEDNLWVKPSIFYPPWGSNSPLLQEVAARHGLVLVDCSNMISPTQVVNNPGLYGACTELAIHWWHKKDRRNLEQALKILGRK